ncbi:glycosyltransferase family 4 protein [Saccharothrix australiensis]|uniref:glycosyltransferase family 4 protein n=1 Tax=Saccharothrix australiensis TaxID=2072 RepID=UPI0011C3F7F0|nr:glycosyltransferase family 4 protein [Saccharothrix australiensis]
MPSDIEGLTTMTARAATPPSRPEPGDRGTAPMRWALVSGDGLPVSGLLTIFRNVVDRALAAGLLELPVTADLGYSWRPDKPGFFPGGPPEPRYPDWLRVTHAVPVGSDPAALAAELGAIRAAVARADRLGERERAELHRRVDALARPYEEHFDRWFADHDVDWVVAVNMTLSDAVPVTTALHRAAARRWGGGRPGGVLYWDHDLFASCAIHERGVRVYPERPNEFTPVPGASPGDRWAVVSRAQERETRAYPTALRPEVLTNVLPVVPDGPLEERHHDFLDRHGIARDRPVVLGPVRVFAVKGVEISVEVFAGMRAECARAGVPDPVLVVFGSLAEDPEYAEVVRRAVGRHGVGDAVLFLDGVPLSSAPDRHGRWRLDEVDLLRVGRASGGAVLFTPNRDDVETVGLGPALAALAGLPCAVTAYQAFEEHFGADFRRVVVTPGRAAAAGAELVRRMVAIRDGDEGAAADLEANLRRVRERFPDGPWLDFLGRMATGR